MNMELRGCQGALLLACGFFQTLAHGQAAENADWLSYGGNEQGHKYSSLTQIRRDNVAASGVHSRMHTEFDERTHADLSDALLAFSLPD